MYTIKKDYRMSKKDVEFLNGLAPNLPETKLKKSEIDTVSSLYYKYIGRKLDNIDWSPALVDMEMSEKWPSGHRMKRHEAQRIVLGFLVNSPIKMTNSEAAHNFFYSLNNRESSRRLTSIIYYKK